MTSTPVSLKTLSDELAHQLLSYLNRMVGSSDADDLLQETLLRIANGLERFEGRTSMKNWAYRIATNVAIDHLRKEKLKVFTPIDTELQDEEDGNDERLILDEMNACVREVIDGLPPDYRAVIILFNLHEKSVKEIADILDISPALVKVRIHRGKRRLENVLQKKCTFYTGPNGAVHCDRRQ